MMSFDETARAITHRVMRDSTDVPVIIAIKEAWQVASALGLARKHPSLGRLTKQELRQIEREFRTAIVARHPEARPALEHAETFEREAFLALSVPVMADEAPMECLFSVRELWLLVGGLQLAVQRPLVPRREAITAIGRQFQAAVVGLHPDAAELIEMGWY